MGETGRTIRRIVLIAAMTAVLEVAKFALNAVANVELITLLVMLYTRKFGWKMSLASVLLFAVLESMWWGVSIWTATYFYVWPILVLVSALTAKTDSVLVNAVIAGVYGLLFGALCSLLTLVTAGWNAAVAWWIAGIPYDLIHGAANFLICLILYRPLYTALDHIRIMSPETGR